MSFTTETDAQSSTLSIPSISPSFHGALFTCEVNITVQEETYIIELNTFNKKSGWLK